MRQTLVFVVLPGDGGQVEQAVSEGITCDVEIPKDAAILPGVGVTSKGLAIYAIAERDGIEDAEKVERSVFICGNGVDLPDGVDERTFRGTFKPGPGSVTLHVYDIVKVPATS